MRKFENLNHAFTWAFDEREDFIKIKNHFNLSDEVESVLDVKIEVSQSDMEAYLLDNSYVTKEGNEYIFED